MNVLVVGVDGLGRQVADMLRGRRQSHLSLVGFVDDAPLWQGQLILGAPVLGTVRDLVTIPHDAVVVALADNDVRRRTTQQLLAAGERVLSVCHPSSVIAGDIYVPPGVIVGPLASLDIGSVLGMGAIIGAGCVLEPHAAVGAFSQLAGGVRLGASAIVGDDACVGVGAVVAIAVGPLLGVALIFTTSAPFVLVNIVAGLVYALAFPFVALDEAQLPAHVDAMLRDFFIGVATMMINRA